MAGRKLTHEGVLKTMHDVAQSRHHVASPRACVVINQRFCLVDSKTLSKEQRDEMLANIHASNEFIGWRVVVLSPNYLSNAMLQR